MGGIALKVAIANTMVAMFGIPMCNGVGAIVHGTNPSHFWGDVPGFHSYGPWNRRPKFAGVREEPCAIKKAPAEAGANGGLGGPE